MDFTKSSDFGTQDWLEQFRAMTQVAPQGWGASRGHLYIGVGTGGKVSHSSCGLRRAGMELEVKSGLKIFR